MHTRQALAGLVAMACMSGAQADPVAGATGAVAPASTAPDSDTQPSSATPADADIYVYPTRGQTPRQLDRDRYECHNWAVTQSHYDPSNPRLAPHQQVRVVEMPDAAPGRDTVTGAIAGAVIGATVAGPRDAGRGAVAGAIAGGVLGATSDAARNRQDNARDDRADAQAREERARFERQASDYRRAISACLEGRGYTVK